MRQKVLSKHGHMGLALVCTRGGVSRKTGAGLRETVNTDCAKAMHVLD